LIFSQVLQGFIRFYKALYNLVGFIRFLKV
jgi:hypothetical protein